MLVMPRIVRVALVAAVTIMTVALAFGAAAAFAAPTFMSGTRPSGR